MDTTAPRPVSSFVTGTLIFFAKYNEYIYFFGLLFFPISVFTIYCILKNIMTKEIASLITLLYSCSLLATSIQFSPIMLNSNLATIFFSLSIYYLYIRKNLIMSSIFFIVSVLSYEIFLPLILLNLFLSRTIKKRIVFIFITLCVIFAYKKILQSEIFISSYQRDDASQILNLKRNLSMGLLSAKLFFRDIFIGIYKGLLNIKKLYFSEL